VFQLVTCDLIYDDHLAVFSATSIQNEFLLLCSRIIFCFIARSVSFPLREINVFARNRRLFIPFGPSLCCSSQRRTETVMLWGA